MLASSHLSKRETSGELDISCVVGEKIEVDTRNLVQMMTQGRGTNYGDKKILIFYCGSWWDGYNIFNKEHHTTRVHKENMVER